MELLEKGDAGEVALMTAASSPSEHAPRYNPTFQIARDGFQNKFVLDTPIDGYGRPAVYLSMLRLICANGLVGL
jgi:hypothetical protein